jgi:hypothetical protein
VSTSSRAKFLELRACEVRRIYLLSTTLTKTLSENFCVNLERRRISPRMSLPTITVLEGDAPYE